MGGPVVRFTRFGGENGNKSVLKLIYDEIEHIRDTPSPTAFRLFEFEDTCFTLHEDSCESSRQRNIMHGMQNSRYQLAVPYNTYRASLDELEAFE